MAETLAQALGQARANGLTRLDAQMLMLWALQRDPHDRAWLLAHDQDTLPDAAQARWLKACELRHDGQPMAYILGTQAFYGIELQVGPAVLVPRADTETLVAWAIEVIDNGPPTMRCWDAGTGSGAIALALASQRPHCTITASDQSPSALAMAQTNAQALGLSIRWALGDWLSALPNEQVDLIVSNPPYIPENDPHLAALHHEPVGALVSGPDGLKDIRTLIAQAPQALSMNGWLLLEHGHDQAPVVRECLGQAGFVQVSSRKDLAGIERCSGGQWPKAS